MAIISGSHLVVGACLGTQFGGKRRPPALCLTRWTGPTRPTGQTGRTHIRRPHIRATALVILAVALHSLAAKRLTYS